MGGFLLLVSTSRKTSLIVAKVQGQSQAPVHPGGTDKLKKNVRI